MLILIIYLHGLITFNLLHYISLFIKILTINEEEDLGSSKVPALLQKHQQLSPISLQSAVNCMFNIYINNK